jgi:hypothetical protein
MVWTKVALWVEKMVALRVELKAGMMVYTTVAM